MFAREEIKLKIKLPVCETESHGQNLNERVREKGDAISCILHGKPNF